MVPSSLSRLLPQSTKRVVRETMQRYRLRMAVQRLLKLSRGGAPAPSCCRRSVAPGETKGWGTSGSFERGSTKGRTVPTRC